MLDIMICRQNIQKGEQFSSSTSPIRYKSSSTSEGDDLASAFFSMLHGGATAAQRSKKKDVEVKTSKMPKEKVEKETKSSHTRNTRRSLTGPKKSDG